MGPDDRSVEAPLGLSGEGLAPAVLLETDDGIFPSMQIDIMSDSPYN
jgi:hypothetical protein